MIKLYFTILFFFLIGSCQSQTSERLVAQVISNDETQTKIPFDSTIKTIHVFVSLCDNKYQGIVPVPSKIGNGQDPDNNLYWGCSFGIRTYFKKSKEWKLIRAEKKDSVILERLIFKHETKNCYLIADAYNGKYIQQCTMNFLSSSSGKIKDTININNTTIGISGNSNLIAYIGHDGLMDFELSEPNLNTDNKKRDIIILACYSKHYFSPHLKSAKVNPLVWTTGLMCPEAYTVYDAITGYLDNQSNEQIRTKAVAAYSKYQKCSEKSARNLLVTDW